MNAAVWRYDVRTKKFEIFAEGTSNPWGMDFDSQGNCFLCCCVIPHLFHIVPGGIYKRQAGASFNPYAYGYLNEICDHTFHKESGWAHAGLLCLDNPNVPEEFRTSVIFGSIHGCSIKRNTLKRNGSTFTASKAPDFLVSGDKNFRPINLRWAPDGSILIIDWHDQNPCHQAKPDAWDKTHGRVYRIQRKGAKSVVLDDLRGKSKPDLLRILANPNPWWYRTALRLIRERKEEPSSLQDLATQSGEIIPVLKELRKDVDPLPILRASSVLVQGSVSDPLDQVKNDELLKQMAQVFPEGVLLSRKFEARWLASMERPSGNMVKYLALVAPGETAPEVRLELASAAGRLAAQQGTLALTHALLLHKEDAADPVIPLMLWYAYEKELAKLASGGRKPSEPGGGEEEKTRRANAPRSPIAEELDWLAKNAPGNPLITDHIINRAMRRLTATGKTEDLAACVAFVGELKHDDILRHALEGLVEGLKGRPQEPPTGWDAVHAKLMTHGSPNIRQAAEQIAEQRAAAGS